MMMKYLLLGCILLVATLGNASARAPLDIPMDASAAFLDTAPAGVTTRVELALNDTPGEFLISLAVHQTVRICAPAGPCREHPVISGQTLQDARPHEAQIDRLRGRASVHTTIRFHDDLSRRTIPIRVDALWTSIGPQVCSPLASFGPSTQVACGQQATVIADVALGAHLLIANQTVPDGRISWRPPS